jgi:hypothetical protein
VSRAETACVNDSELHWQFQCLPYNLIQKCQHRVPVSLSLTLHLIRVLATLCIALQFLEAFCPTRWHLVVAMLPHAGLQHHVLTP